jgi:ribokinase
MSDIITFGSATWDIFMKPKNFQIAKIKKFVSKKGICFNLGSKVDVDSVYFSSGGGGTNTAVFFSKQGFRTAYCGKVGDDISGREIIQELDKSGIETKFIFKTKEKPTNHSVILNPFSKYEKDRTILVYRGAAGLLNKKDIQSCFNDCERNKTAYARWFYIAPLSGKFCVSATEEIIKFAHRNKIKVAFNPGSSQLAMFPLRLIKTLKQVDVLILNQEEASLLTKVSFQEEKKIFSKIRKMYSGIAIITKGSNGSVVLSEDNIYQAGVLKSKIIDRTGAGDSYASGFISGFIRRNADIEYAMQLGTANATSCLKKWGAKNGLLEKGARFKKVKVSKTKLKN